MRNRRTWIIGATVVGVVVAILGVGTTLSYLKAATEKVRQTLIDATPIAFQLQQLDAMIAEIEPEIERSLRAVAQLEVEVEFYERELAEFQQEQEKLFAHMHKLRTELASNKTEFHFAGRTYTRAEVEKELARQLDRYEQREGVLKAKQNLLEEKRRHLQNARYKVASYRDNYNQLVARSEALKAQLQLVEAAAPAGSVAVDTSKLAEAQRLAQHIEMRLRTAQRLLDAERIPLDGVPIDARPVSPTERFDKLLEERAGDSREASEG